MNLTEVTRRGFLAGLGTGAVVGAASGVSRSQQLELTTRWYMLLDSGEVSDVIGPFDSEKQAETYAIDFFDKLGSVIDIDIDVIEGISSNDFLEIVDKEIKEIKDYKQQYNPGNKHKDTYRA